MSHTRTGDMKDTRGRGGRLGSACSLSVSALAGCGGRGGQRLALINEECPSSPGWLVRQVATQPGEGEKGPKIHGWSKRRHKTVGQTGNKYKDDGNAAVIPLKGN